MAGAGGVEAESGEKKRGRKPKGAAAKGAEPALGNAIMDENMLDGIHSRNDGDTDDDDEMVITGEHSDAVAAVMAGTRVGATAASASASASGAAASAAASGKND
jgi:hypothetical protein